jgi:hypothetical protein
MRRRKRKIIRDVRRNRRVREGEGVGRKERKGGRESRERGVEEGSEVNARNQQEEITERRRKKGQEEELECG